MRVVDLAETAIDPLADAVRRTLRQKYDFPPKGPFGISAVYSTEPPAVPHELHYDGGDGFRCVCPGGNNEFHCCEERRVIYGTAGFVTGAFGLACASVVVARSHRRVRSQTRARDVRSGRAPGRLIAVDTHNPGGDEPRLCALLADELRARGGEVRVVEVPREGAVGAYALATWGTPRLLVNAHVDTVPVNEGWSADPFTPRVADGRVVGLGACDTKGAIAAILCALDAGAAARSGHRLHRRRGAHGTVIRALLDARARRPRRGSPRHRLRADLVPRRHAPPRHLVDRSDASAAAAATARAPTSCRRRSPTPRAWRVAFAEWGAAAARGRPARLSRHVHERRQARRRRRLQRHPRRGHRSPSACARRRAPTSSTCASELYALALDVLPRVQLSVPMANPSFHTREPAALRRGARRGAPIDLAFWTEAALLAAAGIDCVVYGPGDIAHAHAPDEFVPIADLERARDTFAAVLAAEAR